jgi:MFS superfamily sulfate permease-like transporter
LVTVAIIVLILVFFTGALAYMPEAALSAIVFLIGIGLIDLAGMRRVFQQRRSEFWLALVTTLTVVIVGVE